MRKVFATLFCGFLVLNTVILSLVIVSPGLLPELNHTLGRQISYTEHVPIFINGTSDFIAQGWYGSGTSGDPFLIEDFNVTTVIDKAAIHVINTDAYFEIVGCYVDQGYTSDAIRIENTSHAVIRATIVRANTQGIYIRNSTNAILEGLEVNATDSYAVDMRESDACQVRQCVLDSANYRGFHAFECPNLNFDQNTVVADDSFYNTYIEESNSTMLSSSTHIDGAAVFILDSFSVTAQNLDITSMNEGVRVFGGADNSIHECEVSDASLNGLFLSSSHRITVTSCQIEDTGNLGMYVYDCDNSSISGVSIMYTTSHAIYTELTENLDLLSITAENIGNTGLYMTGCDGTYIYDNLYSDVTNFGVYIFNSDDGTINNCEVSETGGEALRLDTNVNWTITNNTFSDIDSIGITVLITNNLTLDNNIFSDVTSWVMDLQISDYTVVTNNVIETALSGISAVTCPSIHIDSNSLAVTERGLWLSNCNNANVTGNTIDASTVDGITLSSAVNNSVRNNVITAGRIGIYLMTCTTCEFIDNTLTDCGFFFDPGSIPQYNQTFSGNTVNGDPIYLAQSLMGGSIDVSTYGQVILLDCNGTTISGGTFERCTTSVILAHCVSVTVDGIDSRHNYEGFVLHYSDNITINACTGRHTTYIGILVYVSYYSEISSFILNGAERGIQYTDCYYGTVDSCEVSNTEWGIYAASTDNITVTGSTFHSGGDLIHDGGTNNYWTIESNTLYNATAEAIDIGSGDYWTIQSNNISHCRYGIYGSSPSSDNHIVHNNEINSCDRGIYVSNGDVWTITNNTILWNSEYGIYLVSSGGTTPYYNVIGLSGTENGEDNVATNWDDGVSLGNWWSDFDGVTIPYTVGGGPATDNYPMQFLPTTPIIDSPLDFSYEEGTTGNTLTWKPYDDNLADWSVTLNGAPYTSGVWNFVDVTIDIDGLTYGTYTFVVTVYDVYDNSVTDTVVVNVYDGTAPIISSPKDLTVFVEGTSQELAWSASDLHPDSYEIIQDDTVVTSETWPGGEIFVSLDGLSIGSYVFTARVTDIDGNTASDSVRVTVDSDSTDPMLSSPADFNYTVGEIQNYILWSASDDNPWWYEIEIDNATAIYEEGVWGGWALQINVDGFAVGEYTFQLTVMDMANNTATDTVTVTVLSVGYTPPPPMGIVIPPETLLLIAGIGGAVVVVVVIVYFLRKKRGTYSP